MTRRRRAHKHAHAHIRTDARAHTHHSDDDDDYHIHTARNGRGIFFLYAFTYGCATRVNVPGQLNDSPKPCSENAYGNDFGLRATDRRQMLGGKKNPGRMGKKKNNRTVNVFNGISFVRACACVGACARMCVCYHYKKPCKMDDNTRTHATELARRPWKRK